MLAQTILTKPAPREDGSSDMTKPAAHHFGLKHSDYAYRPITDQSGSRDTEQSYNVPHFLTRY
jgi:hypothetical protein